MNYEMELANEKMKARKEGTEVLLIGMIAAKAKKGMSLSAIADQLEQEEAEILPLYDLVCSMPGASPDEIMKALHTPASK